MSPLAPSPFPSPSLSPSPPPPLTLRALAAGRVHPAVGADAQEAAEEAVLAGGVEVPQPDGLSPAVVEVRAGVGQRQRQRGGGGGRQSEQRQRGGAQPHPGAAPRGCSAAAAAPQPFIARPYQLHRSGRIPYRARFIAAFGHSPRKY